MSETKGFSRKHTSSEPHYAAVAAYRSEHGPEARRRRAKERAELRAKRTPVEQIEILDARLGYGEDAFRERERLERLIGASAT